jgi:hypothetical protein
VQCRSAGAVCDSTALVLLTTAPMIAGCSRRRDKAAATELVIGLQPNRSPLNRANGGSTRGVRAMTAPYCERNCGARRSAETILDRLVIGRRAATVASSTPSRLRANMRTEERGSSPRRQAC